MMLLCCRRAPRTVKYSELALIGCFSINTRISLAGIHREIQQVSCNESVGVHVASLCTSLWADFGFKQNSDGWGSPTSVSSSPPLSMYSISFYPIATRPERLLIDAIAVLLKSLNFPILVLRRTANRTLLLCKRVISGHVNISQNGAPR